MQCCKSRPMLWYIGRYTGFGIKQYGKSSFLFSYWTGIQQYISHVAIYISVNEMKNISKTNILPFFCVFRIQIHLHKLFNIQTHLYKYRFINHFTFCLNLIDRRFDASLLFLLLCSLLLAQSSNCIKETVSEPRTYLSSPPTSTIKSLDLDDFDNS